MVTATKKWIFLKISSVILIPLMLWFIINFVSIYDKNFDEVLVFITKESSKFLLSILMIVAFFFSALSISEIRHLFWDMGYGFELTTSKISGIIVIFGSFVVTILIYILGRQLI